MCATTVKKPTESEDSRIEKYETANSCSSCASSSASTCACKAPKAFALYLKTLDTCPVFLQLPHIASTLPQQYFSRCVFLLQCLHGRYFFFTSPLLFPPSSPPLFFWWNCCFPFCFCTEKAPSMNFSRFIALLCSCA